MEVLVPLQIGVVFNCLCRKILLNQYFLVVLMSKNLPRYTRYLSRWAQFWTTNSEDKIYNTIVTSN